MPNETTSQGAEDALAAIRKDQAILSDRVNSVAAPDRRWIVAGVLGLAVAALLFNNGPVLGASISIYLAGVMVVMGTPVRAGVAPRSTRGQLFQSITAATVLLLVHAVGVAGMMFDVWWLTAVAAVFATAVTVGMFRWKQALQS